MKSPFLHLILACSALVITLGMYGAWYSAIGAKSVAVAGLEKQILAKTEAANRIASARASLAEIAGDEASMQSYFVPETGVVAFINNLEAQGQRQGASVNVLSVSTDNAGKRPALTFAIVIRGTFDAVMRTVGAIEYAPYDLSVSSLSLSQDDTNAWHANLNFIVGSVPADAATSTP